MEAYKTVFREPGVVFKAYGTTIVLTLVGTAVGLVLLLYNAYLVGK